MCAAAGNVDPKWIRTASDRAAVEAGCYFDHATAERVRLFFAKFLKHTNGAFAGNPFELLPWQYDGIIAPLFGWRQADGRRRFDRAYLSTPKKNGKTTLLAGLAIYLLIADGEPGAEVYSAAADREQAAMIYREAAKMVELSPALSKKLRDFASTKTLVGPGRSFYRALSAEAKTKEGLNAHAILFDELHAQPGRELWDCLAYAGSARRQSMHLAITTAGGDLQTICGEQYQLAKRVLSGELIDTTFFAYVAEADLRDDWASEETWIKANPSWGVTIEPAKFRAAFNEARESPAKENSFRRYRLNQWVQTADAWLSMDQWDACGAAKVDAADLAGRRCYAGLDLSATDDTTALVLIFPEEEGVTVLPFFWLPEENIGALERKHKAPYRAWAKAGLFNLTPGNVVDYQCVRAKLRELAGQFKIEELSIDRKFQGQSLESELIDDGFNVVPAGQGWVSQDVPAKELERLLKSGRVAHGAHPVLRWHASNVVVDIDKNNNYTINKKRSRSKIDGIAALLMGLFCLMRNGGGDLRPYYDEFPELIVLS